MQIKMSSLVVVGLLSLSTSAAAQSLGDLGYARCSGLHRLCTGPAHCPPAIAG